MQVNLRKKWKRLIAFGVIWAFILFPIPFLPFFSDRVDPQAIQALIIITAVVSVPFALLFIFMK